VSDDMVLPGGGVVVVSVEPIQALPFKLKDSCEFFESRALLGVNLDCVIMVRKTRLANIIMRCKQVGWSGYLSSCFGRNERSYLACLSRSLIIIYEAGCLCEAKTRTVYENADLAVR
jgi:hypothetical protein